MQRPSGLRQLIDLGFPFSLYEQAPLVGRGIPAVTLTTGGNRPAYSFGDSPDRLDDRNLTQLGQAAQDLLSSLDQGLELARGTGSIEADYLNGEIVLLGRLHGVDTPANAALQRVANGMARERLPAGSLSIKEVEAEVWQPA